MHVKHSVPWWRPDTVKCSFFKAKITKGKRMKKKIVLVCEMFKNVPSSRKLQQF